MVDFGRVASRIELAILPPLAVVLQNASSAMMGSMFRYGIGKSWVVLSFLNLSE